MIQPDGSHQLFLPILMYFPTPHVMAASDDARFDAFGYPGAHYEIANLSFHAHQVAGLYVEVRRMRSMQPERIRVRDFVQPLRVGAARVNLNRQTESRDQNRLIRFEIIRMNMALDVSRYRVFAPAPIGERFRIEFEPAAWGREATFDFVINFYPDKSTTVRIAVRTGNRNHIRRGGFRGAGEHAAKMIFGNIVELFGRHCLFMDRADLLCDFKCAVAAHEFERIQIFLRGLF